MSDRWDETWHRLREWTNGQGPSERLSAQVLLFEGFQAVDPSHPLGGKDGGKDALCQRDGLRWVMAVYFPRGQQDFANIKKKFLADLAGVAGNQAGGIAFVTNQELRLSERKDLCALAAPDRVEIYHLERIATVLDSPAMSQVRHQFLGIGGSESAVVQAKRLEATEALWQAIVELRNRHPSIIGILHIVTYDEEKVLNQIPCANSVLRGLTEDEMIRWSDILQPVEKHRPILGEDLWLLAFVTRAIFMRIIWVLIRERSRSVMLPWRDDDGIRSHLSKVCTPEEIAQLLALRIGAIDWLWNLLEAKILARIEELQKAHS